MKTFKFSLVLRTRENTDVFISLDDNIYGIHSKRINIFYLPHTLWAYPADDKFDDIFPKKHDLESHANCLQFAWTVKSCFLGK